MVAYLVGRVLQMLLSMLVVALGFGAEIGQALAIAG